MWVGLVREAFQWKERWVHLLVNPAFLALPPVFVCVWYPVEQGRDAEEEPRSSVALDWGDGQASLHVVPPPWRHSVLDEASAPARQ